MNVEAAQLEEWRAELAGMTPAAVLSWAAQQFGGKVAFASSLGLEDQVITDLIAKHAPGMSIFTLDTGRLFPETYELLARIEERYGLRVEIYFPEADEVEQMVHEHGINLFRDSVEQRQRCCGVRKIAPLRRALTGLQAWVCGLRREQSVTRAGVGVIEWDEGNGLFRVNPLYDWTTDQLWEYIRAEDVPYNALHDQGFLSIGCSCCTRAAEAGEGLRAGRWWWEEPEHKECGLHIVDGKIVPGPASE